MSRNNAVDVPVDLMDVTDFPAAPHATGYRCRATDAV